MKAIWRTAGLLAVLACALAFGGAPASASTRETQLQADAFQVPAPAVPFRDAVINRPSQAMARTLAASSHARVPVNDGQGRSAEIDVSLACQVSCTDASPTDVQNLANFLGSLVHGDEMNTVVINVVSPAEIATQCGPGALSCYYPSTDLIVLNGNNSTASDGATRDYVLAHEYGHHVANHRHNPPFDDPAINWGPKNWATYERVCEGVRSGVYFPGSEDLPTYYSNPGEAWAEAFAQHRLPGIVDWEWNASLQPDANAFHAMDRDVLQPWDGPTRTVVRGRLGAGHRRVIKSVPTPLDGTLSLKLRGARHTDFDLLLRDSGGRTLAYSTGLGSRESVTYTVCGEANLRAVVKRMTGAGRFKLVELIP
jgi:hypothetical protein